MLNRIAAARKHLGLTQQQLADTIGATVAALAAWESGSATPSVEDMVAVARVLDLPVDFLLCRDNGEKMNPSEYT